jgi:3-methylcrotonyl-CoA carboxylase alpha subunit
MFTKILIANRGEIACRVATTARRLGVRTVAVYSDADAGSKHVASCDEAVHIGGAAARDSYLVMDRIIAAAKSTGAQAIHPGYGFLSENEDFAALCAKEGLVFIGPPPEAISAMGLKSAAKALMEKAQVPLVPGYHGEDQTPSLLEAQAKRIGFPVLIKASAGGGGKGMRVVEKAEDFIAALESCKREASNAFGDDAVLVEKYLTRPRHIEVQVFADRHGGAVYLFERDCSVQRRHQKVLEEAPAPGMSEARRKAMGEAAVAAAKAVGYVGAGTVEFIAEGDSFFFMEMNTRLQVEHPVTEMISGFDLVEWQLKVAAGERLPVTQAELTIHGHALEARVYAENPEKGFLPSIGTLKHLHFPPHVAFVRCAEEGGVTPAAVRVDAGVREGDAITPNYDPMIAKLIVWGENREQALLRMSEALGQTHIVGLSTNVAFLKRLVESKPFMAADLDTGLIARNHAALFPEATAPSASVLALAVAGVLAREAQAARGSVDPWALPTGWRLNQAYVRALSFVGPTGPLEVRVRYDAQGHWLVLGGQAQKLTFSAEGAGVQVMLGDQPARGTVIIDGETLHVFSQGLSTVLELPDALAHAQADEGKGGLVAPMPGKIVSLLAAVGAPLKKGAPLLVMEAMKMEHTITAPADGAVGNFLFRPGDQVAEGAALLEFQPAK